MYFSKGVYNMLLQHFHTGKMSISIPFINPIVNYWDFNILMCVTRGLLFLVNIIIYISYMINFISLIIFMLLFIS